MINRNVYVMKKIIWVDDDLEFSGYDNDEKAFKQSGYKVIKVIDPSELFDGLKDEMLFNGEIACIIVDMSWPMAIRKGFTSMSGLAVGAELLKKLDENDSKFKNVKKVVYTITNDEEIQTYCKSRNIMYLNKISVYGNGFVTSVLRFINQKRIVHE